MSGLRNVVRLRSGSLRPRLDRTVHRVIFRSLACLLAMVLWVGSPAVARADSHKGEKLSSSYDRQLDAASTLSKKGSGSVDLVHNQPPNSFVQYGDVWGCNDGYRKTATTCVSIFAAFGGQPTNSYVQYGTIWGCKDGFRKETDKCVSAFTKRKSGSKAKEAKLLESLNQ